jgi:hypothetical protein
MLSLFSEQENNSHKYTLHHNNKHHKLLCDCLVEATNLTPRIQSSIKQLKSECGGGHSRTRLEGIAVLVLRGLTDKGIDALHVMSVDHSYEYLFSKRNEDDVLPVVNSSEVVFELFKQVETTMRPAEVIATTATAWNW